MSSIGKLHFATFHAGRRCWYRSALRLAKQAEDSQLFSEITIGNMSSLRNTACAEDIDWIEDLGSRFERGYGLWSWKLVFLESLLSRIPSGDILLYMDAGCSLNINPQSSERMGYYRALADKHGALYFQQNLLEKDWSKQSLRNWFPEDANWNSGQLLGGIHFTKSTRENLDFFGSAKLLAQSSESEALLEPSASDMQLPSFRAHRHDQSILSLMAKERRVFSIPDETYFAPDWPVTGVNHPIWASRLCSGNPDLSHTIWGRVRRQLERRLPF